MKRNPVQSSALLSEGYDERQQVLEVEYVNGGVYQYFPVSPEVYGEFREAESKGTYINLRIKPNYQCREVRRRTA